MRLKKQSFMNFLYISAGILLFLFAIELLTSSTGALAPELENFMVFIDNPLNALGLGWISSYIMLSGYPVTVFGLSLFDSGVISEISTFFVVNGSRLGASLIVIVIGVVESLRKKDLDMIDSTSIGFMTLLITYTIVLPAILIGLLIVRMDLLNVYFELEFLSLIDIIYQPIVDSVLNFFGPYLGVLIALVTLYFALSIFEKPFHRMKVENFKSSWINFLMERKIYSFLFGAVLTFFSQSVALSIGLIVPIYNRGFLQRRNLIPYIMGACVTTFGGTLAVSFLIGNEIAINLTLAIIIANLLVSLFYLYFYREYHSYISNLTNFFLQKNSRLFLLLFAMFVSPFLLLVVV